MALKLKEYKSVVIVFSMIAEEALRDLERDLTSKYDSLSTVTTPTVVWNITLSNITAPLT